VLSTVNAHATEDLKECHAAFKSALALITRSVAEKVNVFRVTANAFLVTKALTAAVASVRKVVNVMDCAYSVASAPAIRVSLALLATKAVVLTTAMETASAAVKQGCVNAQLPSRGLRVQRVLALKDAPATVLAWVNQKRATATPSGAAQNAICRWARRLIASRIALNMENALMANVNAILITVANFVRTSSAPMIAQATESANMVNAFATSTMIPKWIVL